MNHELAMYPNDKQEMYALLLKQLRALMEGEESLLPHLCNAAALIYGALKDINWAGFYLLQEDSLLLGPFQGKPACIRIPLGKGVCGTAAAQDCAVVLDDADHEMIGTPKRITSAEMSDTLPEPLGPTTATTL